jgi:serine protease AprX
MSSLPMRKPSPPAEAPDRDTPDLGSTCPICRQHAARGDLLGAISLDDDVAQLVAANMPGWHPELGLCRDCVRRFAKSHAYLVAHHPRFARGGVPILPTTLRLGALERYKGRGVTVAFLDSGFYAHPDLVEPRDRILGYVDITRPRARREDLAQPDDSSWHGMMTSVVACGNGRLSGGVYRGLASEADVVLVKCGSVRRITHDDIRRGLDWVLRNRRRYRIRVVNVSCGGDYSASYLVDGLSQAAERATREGLLVCAAVGNLGHVPGHPVLPPASAPSVLTVGGVNDKNRLAFSGYEMYHSSYGPTLDGLQKPEVIAPGIFVAAPLLPGTATAERARILARLAAAPDRDLPELLAAHRGFDPALAAATGQDARTLRGLVTARVREENLISEHYKHVDGTSFAAPIVASIAAQMLEANPKLTPQQVKRLVIGTARRLSEVETDRQGWGAVDAERAVLEALAPDATTDAISAEKRR